MKTLENTTDLMGRVLIAAMFLIAGIGKISGYAGTQGYMQSMGVPGALLPLVIALEIFGAIAIIVGYRTRFVAAALAGFTLAAGFIFHGGADQMRGGKHQRIARPARPGVPLDEDRIGRPSHPFQLRPGAHVHDPTPRVMLENCVGLGRGHCTRIGHVQLMRPFAGAGEDVFETDH